MTWYTNNTLLTHSTNTTKKNNTITSTLHLQFSNTSRTKSYICKAENHLGSLDRKFTLKIVNTALNYTVNTKQFGNNSLELTLHPNEPLSNKTICIKEMQKKFLFLVFSATQDQILILSIMKHFGTWDLKTLI